MANLEKEPLKTTLNHPWSLKYWDMHNQFYWAPHYLGLKSIPKKHIASNKQQLIIPTEEVKQGASLYTRSHQYDALKEKNLTQEEILNHLFALTFAIAPSRVIDALFAQPLAIASSGHFVSLGREMRHRYGWGKSENVTTSDGFFVCDNALIGVELKLDARSSAQQILKYAYLFLEEERICAPREFCGLLYIVPEHAIATHWKHCGLASAQIDADFLQKHPPKTISKRILQSVEENSDAYAELFKKMRLAVISWTDLANAMNALISGLDTSAMGEETLYRLLHGFAHQLHLHQKTGIAPDTNAAAR
jgi:hypothetical protein